MRKQKIRNEAAITKREELPNGSRVIPGQTALDDACSTDKTVAASFFYKRKMKTRKGKYFIWYGGFSSTGSKPVLKETIEASGAKEAKKYAREKYGKDGWAELMTPFAVKEAKKLGLI